MKTWTRQERHIAILLTSRLRLPSTSFFFFFFAHWLSKSFRNDIPFGHIRDNRRIRRRSSQNLITAQWTPRHRFISERSVWSGLHQYDFIHCTTREYQNSSVSVKFNYFRLTPWVFYVAPCLLPYLYTDYYWFNQSNWPNLACFVNCFRMSVEERAKGSLIDYIF